MFVANDILGSDGFAVIVIGQNQYQCRKALFLSLKPVEYDSENKVKNNESYVKAARSELELLGLLPSNITQLTERNLFGNDRILIFRGFAGDKPFLHELDHNRKPIINQHLKKYTQPNNPFQSDSRWDFGHAINRGNSRAAKTTEVNARQKLDSKLISSLRHPRMKSWLKMNIKSIIKVILIVI